MGAILTFYMGVNEENYDNLPKLIVITSLLSLIPLPFIGIIKEEELEKAKEQGEAKRLLM